MRKGIMGILSLCMVMCMLSAGCGAANAKDASSDQAAVQSAETGPEGTGEAEAESTVSEPEAEEKTEEDAPQAEEDGEAETERKESEMMLQMTIGETLVDVEWEDNESVEALKELCQEGPLTIRMSMYGGFEQVGSVGQSLPRDDNQTTTQAGDIVLYSGDQIVVFYGSNSWAYTRLGHITDKTAQEMAELLGKGDVTITTIKCADGETIMLCHNTSLPRPYSRRNVLQGTKGIWSEDKNCIYLEGISEKADCWEPIDKYYEKYEHPLWKAYREGGKLMQNKEGHGGMDYLVQRAFFEADMAGTQTPIDVYDTVSWMAVTCLSEDSIAKGGMPVPMPDFTNGRWFTRNDIVPGPYCLDEVCWKYFE